jgi:TPR repeat protein
MACRGKTICTGCSYEHEQHDNSTCPFCRKSQPRTEQQLNVLVNKRLEANDPKAIYQLGCMYVNGNDDSNNIKKNIGKSIELFHRAAELGCAQAYHKLADIYFNGIGVSKDHAKRAVLQEGCYGRMYNFKIESRLL